jgi:predicted Zn-dependent peptidase
MSTITTHLLTSQTPLAMEQMSGVRSVGVTFLIPAGSATEPEDKQGLSSMWSELLLRGSGDLDSRGFADAMDSLGSSRSADGATWHMRLSFTLLGTRLLDLLPHMAEMVRTPRFEDAAIEPTRDLALQSLESLKDDPQERAVISLRERHNPWPLNRSGLGTIEGINAITRSDLIDGWKARACPDGSIISVAGDLESAGGPDAIARRLEVALKGWAGAAPAFTIKPSTTKGTYHHIDDPSSQVQVVLMHDAPKEGDPDSKLERIVLNVLSGGMAARLFTEVREKRALCYAVSASYAADRDYGRCLAYVGTQPERAQESLDVLLSELQRVHTPEGAITPEEFQRAMIGIRSNLVLAGESTAARSAALASDIFRIGRPRSLDEIAREYAAITLDQVNDYLKRRTIGPITIVTLGPSSLKPPIAS